MERLWIIMTSYSIDFESIAILYSLYNMSYHSKSRVVLCRIRLFPTMISKIKLVGSRLPLNFLLTFLPEVKGFKTISDWVAYILCTFTIENFPAWLHEAFFNDIDDWMKLWIFTEWFFHEWKASIDQIVELKVIFSTDQNYENTVIQSVLTVIPR